MTFPEQGPENDLIQRRRKLSSDGSSIFLNGSVFSGNVTDEEWHPDGFGLTGPLNQRVLSLKAWQHVIEENGEYERNVQPWEGLRAAWCLHSQKTSRGSTCPTYQNLNARIFCSVFWGLIIYVMDFPPNMDKCLFIHTRGCLGGCARTTCSYLFILLKSDNKERLYIEDQFLLFVVVFQWLAQWHLQLFKCYCSDGRLDMNTMVFKLNTQRWMAVTAG